MTGRLDAPLSMDAATAEKCKEEIQTSRREFYQQYHNNPIRSHLHDADISRELREYCWNHEDTVVIRFFFYGPKHEESNSRSLGAFVFANGELRVIEDLPWSVVSEATAKMLLADQSASAILLPANYPELIWNHLFAPLWADVSDLLKGGAPQRLIIIPSESLFSVPLHVAAPSESDGSVVPIAARFPIVYSVSATSFLTFQRHQRQRFSIEDGDDVCMLFDTEYDFKDYPLQWSTSEFHYAGPPTVGIGNNQPLGDQVTMDIFGRITEIEPEILVIYAHGLYSDRLRDAGAFLSFQSSDLRINQFDIARRIDLPNNKLTILAACLTGQGAASDGGEVAGFVRAFTAAGCGAIAMTLWSVKHDQTAKAVRHILEAAKQVRDSDAEMDIVSVIHDHYRSSVENLQNGAPSNIVAECVPLAIYV